LLSIISRPVIWKLEEGLIDLGERSSSVELELCSGKPFPIFLRSVAGGFGEGVL
jgi:hypothetical protein